AARVVIYVPALVVISAAFTYGLFTFMFNFFNPGAPIEKGANPQAVARNERPYNERVADISSQDPNAPVKQPRLEAIREVEKKPNEPTFYRSMGSADTGNSPELRPEDLRPENFIDWNTGEKPL